MTHPAPKTREPFAAPCESDAQFCQLIEEITRQFEANGQLDEASLLRAHPEYAQHLSNLLPTIRAMAGWAAAEGKGDEVFSKTDLPAGSRLPNFGDFRILREVGRGGMGVVYEAEQISIKRRVAVKILPLAAVMDPRQVQRFKNEVQAVALLQHQNIVPVHSVGCERGIHYYAMQYVEGRTLAEMIAELRLLSGIDIAGQQDRPSKDSQRAQIVGALTKDFQLPAGEYRHQPQDASPRSGVFPPPVDETQPVAALSTERSPHNRHDYQSLAHLVIQAAEALDHAHTRGVLHRDIKPANLMVDATGNLWITDFGLARLETDVGMTMTGDVLGTLRYMSPEQALAKRVMVDHRSDIYSLGATLYELLALRPVFSGTDRQEVLRQIALEEPQPLRKLLPTVPRELEIITHKALEKNPVDRYETAQELADDLRRFLDDRPILAKPPTPMNRAARWSRRHRGVLVAMIAATMLAWAMASVWIWRQNYEVIHQRDRATSYAELADKNLNRAVNTIDQLLDRVENEPLLKREEMQPLREAFLQDAVRFNEQLIEDSRDYPEATFAVAEAYSRIANIQRSQRRFDESFAAFDMASSLYERLAAKSPPNFSVPRARMAQSLHDHAIALIDRGNDDDVRVGLRLLEKLRRQWEVLGQVADKSWGRTFVKISLAGSIDSMAWAHSKLGNHDQAESSYREALSTLEDIPKEDWNQQPETRLRRDYLMAYASASHALAGTLSDTNRPVEGEKWYRQAIDIHEQVAEYWPDDANRRLAPLGQVKFGFGLTLLGGGRNKEAAEMFRSSLEHYRELVEHSPEIPGYQRMKAAAQYYLANVIVPAGGNDEEVEQLCRDAVETLETLTGQFPDWRNDLFQAHRALGDYLAFRDAHAAEVYQKSIDVARELAEESPDNKDDQQRLSFALIRLARYKLDQNDFEGARDLLQRSLDIRQRLHTSRPDDVYQGTRWAECHIEMARVSNDFNEIRDQLQTAVAYLRSVPAQGDHFEAVFQRFLVYRFDDQPDQAEAALKEILGAWRRRLKKNPHDAGVMRRLSGIQTKTPFAHLADYDEALRCIQRVHEYSPGGKQISLEYDNAFDYQNASDYGWALYRLERFDEAEPWFDQAECTKNPFAAFGRALAKAKLGKLEEGRPYYELGVEYLQRYFLWERPQYAVFREAAAEYDDEARLENLVAERWVAK